MVRFPDQNGNDSIFGFRRDAKYAADILIEEINWHRKPAIKQYKTDGSYFSQVIVTNDGWFVGYGGQDDGEDSQRIENITANMVTNGIIDNASLEQIQQIKQLYGKGHVLIKAPDGTYGVAMRNTYFTGHLDPGEYISIPNQPGYIRSGSMQMNVSDPIRAMHELETTDSFGVDRRDITVFDFHHVENDTFRGNITNITLSNDAGSVYNIKPSGQIFDDLHFNGTVFKGENIPIAPSYQSVGVIEYSEPFEDSSSGFVFNVFFYLVILVLILILFVLVIRLVNKIRYARKRKRQYRSLYRDDRYRRYR